MQLESIILVSALLVVVLVLCEASQAARGLELERSSDDVVLSSESCRFGTKIHQLGTTRNPSIYGSESSKYLGPPVISEQVFFCDPLVSSGDIWGFLVQWDKEESFAQAIGGEDYGAGCSEMGFGSCLVSDAAIAGQCPYSLLITGLTEGEV